MNRPDQHRFASTAPRHRQAGSITLFAALAAVVLLGFVALAIDIGRGLVVRTELQNAADACALAGALELNGLSDSAIRARATGRYVGGTRNRKDFQSVAVDIPTASVTFSETLNGTYVSSAVIVPARAKYIKCAVSQSGFASLFAGVIGIESVNLNAVAIGAVQPAQSVCAIPMAMCAANAADGANFGFTAGSSWQELGSTPTAGFFTWANVTDSSDTTQAIYQEAFSQNGQCGAMTAAGTCIGVHTGAMNDLKEDWNARFGLYKSSSKLNPAVAANSKPSIPDLTGYGYNPKVAGFSVASALSDYRTVRLPARSPYSGANIASYSVPANVNRDFGASFRRLTAMPVVDCASSCGSGGRKVIGWACVLMLAPVDAAVALDQPKVAYIGNAKDPGSPCRAAGVPGGDDAIGPLVPVLVR